MWVTPHSCQDEWAVNLWERRPTADEVAREIVNVSNLPMYACRKSFEAALGKPFTATEPVLVEIVVREVGDE